jgi:hypothetical protein
MKTILVDEGKIAQGIDKRNSTRMRRGGKMDFGSRMEKIRT